MKRIHSIDIVRGIVMIIMALDHVRDLMHETSITQIPTDLNTASPQLFFTRWITHLCAPIFVFLAGSSVHLSLKNKNDIKSTKELLLKRGFWLLILELTIVNFAIFFDIRFHTLIIEVIASIGFGFIILGLLLKLSSRTIGYIGLAIIFCHNLLPIIPLAESSVIRTILAPLFSPTIIPFLPERVFIIGYPPIPWLGIIFLGYACGHFFTLPDHKKTKLFLRVGVGALLLFIIIRFINIYGDNEQWTTQKNGLYTFLSFMNVSKYPPSLLFCLVTLGIMFLMLAVAEKVHKGIQKFTIVYGKVPLFYFVLHFYFIHILTLVMLLLQGIPWSEFEFSNGTFGRPKGIETGIPLWTIYAIWIFVVLVLYKPCLWFGNYKATHNKWWLKYI